MRFILEELREELETVEEVLSMSGISTFHFVSPSNNVVLLKPISEPRWSLGLTRVVNYLQVAYSPNSSGTAQAALSSIADAIRVIASKAKEENSAITEQHFCVPKTMEDRQKILADCGPLPLDSVGDVVSQLRRTLQSRLESRGCHVELRRITEFVINLETNMTNESQIADCRERLITLDIYREKFQKMLQADGETMIKVRDSFWCEWQSRQEGKESQSVLTILCFGNSATVADILTQCHKYGYKRLFCYVGEGRPKTQHGARNTPTYLDAETYARTIRESAARWKCSCQIDIQIVPDIAIGTVMDPNHVAGRDCVKHPKVDAVVFGANGIFVDANGKDVSIAHTCGHLAIAATARQLNIPVFVVAGSAKIRIGDAGRWHQLEREKPTEWIGARGSGVLSRLMEVGAERAWNPREDHVPISLINAIATEFGVCCGDDAINANQKLREWAKLVDETLLQYAFAASRDPQ